MTFRSRLLSIAATFILAVPLAVAMQSTPAYADSGNQCNTESGFLICVNVTGSGDYVQTMKGWVRNTSGYRQTNLHIELYYFQTNGLIKNCAAFALNNNTNSPNCIWSPNKIIATGDYCTRLWQETSPNYYENLGDFCAAVHP